MRGSAPGERRGGRQAGTPNRKTAMLRDMLDAEKANPALSLVKIARTAEERDDLELAAECWGKLAGFAYPKPRPVVIDPDALVDLEGRIAAARLMATAQAMDDNPGLADRLERAVRSIVVVTGVERAPDDLIVDAIAERLERAVPAEPTMTGISGSAGEPAIEPEPEPTRRTGPATPPGPKPMADRAPYKPVTPWPEANRFQGTMDANYRPFED